MKKLCLTGKIGLKNGIATTNIRKRSSAAHADFSQLENLAMQITNLNAMAKKRKVANAFREKLSKALTAIDKTQAEKFFANEFNVLQYSSVEKLIADNDEAVLKSFQTVYAEIADFQA